MPEDPYETLARRVRQKVQVAYWIGVAVGSLMTWALLRWLA